jgi:hypothetical protein
VWGDVIEVSATVIECAKHLVVDWKLANISTVADLIPQRQPLQSFGGGNSATVGNSAFATSSTWHHPFAGRYKCNIHATFSSHFNRTDIRIFVRDSEGTFVLAKVISYPCLHSVHVGGASSFCLAMAE